MNKQIVRYNLNCYRSATLQGVFILTDEELDAVQQMGSPDIYYGEIAGKYTEVEEPLRAEDIEIVSTSPEDIAFFERLFPEGVGFPFKICWFDLEEAHERGCEASWDRAYPTVEVALGSPDYSRYNVVPVRKAFVQGFEETRKDNP